MALSSDYLQYVLEQLAKLPSVSYRRMFGGAGLYSDATFFAIIASDTLYFKVDDETRPVYESRGMGAFRPYKDRPEWSMSYFEVPADVLEDADELIVWARGAVRAAARVAESKRPVRKSAKKKQAARRKK
ncbi:TfoX/Sxy family protein [Steroidobacter sp.]|uniref:TfoX/Sxy family protein n=1 Tax=Steroidobacter sp. TaxID=1978227 RepID=UPI001A4C5716|nr:TfoX/Sxy family protein [Steroidobacter sp.]MBL8269727.1 TfoX/Sxy family protein [Steroidobacter sp.]